MCASICHVDNDKMRRAWTPTHVGHAALGNVLLRVEDALDGPGRELLNLALQQGLHHVRQPEHLPLARRTRQPASNQSGFGRLVRLHVLARTNSHWSTNVTKHFAVNYFRGEDRRF